MINFTVLKALKDLFLNPHRFKTSAKQNIIFCNGKISKVVTYNFALKIINISSTNLLAR